MTKQATPKRTTKKTSKPRTIKLAENAPVDGTGVAIFDRIVTILEDARTQVVRTVNSEMVLAYWHIGRELVEQVQGGASRADYGDDLLRTLSKQLTARFGRGYSVTNLKYFRLFFQAYSHREAKIRHEASDELASGRKRHMACDVFSTHGNPVDLTGFSGRLGWSHYRVLSQLEQPAERQFYEIEAEREGWSVLHLERQIHTQLFTRLLKSRDKAGVMALASHGQVLERPIAILDKLQHFLLELGKGFAFVGRQHRVSFEDETLYVDLVFYNVVLKCYLLIDLKIGKLTHQDVGQMDSYVRLFDHQVTTEGDGPTIGLICIGKALRSIEQLRILPVAVVGV